MEKEQKTLSLKKGGIVWITWNLVEALLLITMGVITIINCNSEGLDEGIFIAISIFLLVGGALRIITNFIPFLSTRKADDETKAFIKLNMSYEMSITGAVELALGIALLMTMTGSTAAALITYITTLIIDFTSVLFMVAGVTLIGFAIGFYFTKFYKLPLCIVDGVFGIATTALGVIIMTVFKENVSIVIKILLVVIGVFLILGGIFEIILTVKSIIKNKNKEENSNVPAKRKNKDVVEHDEPIKEEHIEEKEEAPLAIEEKPEPLAIEAKAEEVEIIEIEEKSTEE